MMFNSELLKDFEDRIENWDSLKKIADVLVKKGPFLRLYATYLRSVAVNIRHLGRLSENLRVCLVAEISN